MSVNTTTCESAVSLLREVVAGFSAMAPDDYVRAYYQRQGSNIVYMTEEALFLVKHGRSVGLPLIARSAFESAFIIKASGSDATFGARRLAYELYDWRQRAGRVAREQSFDIEDSLEPVEQLERAIREQFGLTDDFRKNPLHIRKTAEIGGMLVHYQAEYDYLSSHTHAGLIALIDRGLEDPTPVCIEVIAFSCAIGTAALAILEPTPQSQSYVDRATSVICEVVAMRGGRMKL